jgi:threonine dehydrogenase-like Zn-dependent dehydrogenase
LPTGYHGCVSAGVTTGSTVLISGAGPVGLAAASAAFLLGAAVVIVADFNRARLEHARRSAAKQSISRKAVRSASSWRKFWGFRKWIVRSTA